MTNTKIYLLIGAIILVVIIAVTGVVLYKHHNKTKDKANTALVTQQKNEEDIFNDLNAKKISLNSVQFLGTDNSVSVRLTSAGSALTATDVLNSWKALDNVYTDYPSVANYNVYVMSGSTKVLSVTATRTDFGKSLTAADQAKVKVNDPSTVTTILNAQTVVSATPIANVLN